MLMMLQTWRLWSITVFSVILILLYGSLVFHGRKDDPLQTARTGWGSTQNSTLGFGKIFMVVMPQRTDQRDTTTLLSYFSEIDITIVDGVVGAEIIDEAIPGGGGRPDNMNDPEIGCWRAHMDILRRVVDERLETALILEADVDWDVRVKSQLARLSESLPGATIEKPYGSSWMSLWLGHCRHRSNPNKVEGPALKYADDTVGTIKDFPKYEQADFTRYELTEDNHRLIIPAWRPLCMHSYAVTIEGALRMLHDIGYERMSLPVDVEFAEATKSGRLPSLLVTPPLMAQWKTGSMSIDSSMMRNDSFKPGSGAAVRQSVRAALKGNVDARTLKRMPTEIEGQGAGV